MPLQNKIRTVIPTHVEARLLGRRAQFTDMISVFHCIEVFPSHWVGVAGDGHNGSYEWFVQRGDLFSTSDCGYGSPEPALRDVLAQEVQA